MVASVTTKWPPNSPRSRPGRANKPQPQPVRADISIDFAAYSSRVAIVCENVPARSLQRLRAYLMMRDPSVLRSRGTLLNSLSWL